MITNEEGLSCLRPLACLRGQLFSCLNIGFLQVLHGILELRHFLQVEVLLCLHGLCVLPLQGPWPCLWRATVAPPQQQVQTPLDCGGEANTRSSPVCPPLMSKYSGSSEMLITDNQHNKNEVVHVRWDMGAKHFFLGLLDVILRIVRCQLEHVSRAAG